MVDVIGKTFHRGDIPDVPVSDVIDAVNPVGITARHSGKPIDLLAYLLYGFAFLDLLPSYIAVCCGTNITLACIFGEILIIETLRCAVFPLLQSGIDVVPVGIFEAVLNLCLGLSITIFMLGDKFLDLFIGERPPSASVLRPYFGFFFSC